MSPRRTRLIAVSGLAIVASHPSLLQGSSQPSHATAPATAQDRHGQPGPPLTALPPIINDANPDDGAR
ncbi:hypothetical protein [Planotetraspora mira]|uniref:Uncharacterized protein n=1 Tax=Planotetraspora mira TaxID=58121 RepID=A0A8J3X9J3_9ACTN|nr:hypothetical protein [Planotetraspora mira]GII32900.1 hypothetical protein Pmi06nite_63420 [Planotetraspora mira]